MSSNDSSMNTKLRVGIFTVFGMVLVGAVTVVVNDRPYWWRPCQVVHINIEDATGLKTKSPIRSLGLNIGYLESVLLSETSVRLKICITAPVQVLPTTRAYIRGEGFLGDKFVELKPVKYTGGIQVERTLGGAEDSNQGPLEIKKGKDTEDSGEKLDSNKEEKGRRRSSQHQESDAGFTIEPGGHAALSGKAAASFGATKGLFGYWFYLSQWVLDRVIAAGSIGDALAQRGESSTDDSREIPVGKNSQDVQQLVDQVNGLIGEMSSLTNNLRQAINPEDLRKTMQQLNATLENASKTLSPQGGLTTTAQRTLAKLEDAVEQMRDMLTRVNQGKGSVGAFINDSSFADEIRAALKKVNRMLSKVDTMQFVIDLGVAQVPAYDGARGWAQLSIWPDTTRYYAVGLSSDPRGSITTTTTTTFVGNQTTTIRTAQVTNNAFVFTVMLGKVLFNRLDLSAGLRYGDGAASAMLNFGPDGDEKRFQFRTDIYGRNQPTGNAAIDARTELTVRPWWTTYARVGIDSFRQVNGELAYYGGVGVTFDDEDIRLLFAFR